jgi:uncharacterized membrane protein YdjX (TVP38/TMEM64 family)/rhodanese-related sulfurtransferase
MIRPAALLPRLGFAALIGGAIAWAALTQEGLDLSTLEANLRNLGGWAPVGFIASFALATVLFVPGSIFGLAGGALFGPVWGTAWNLAGATLGATFAFLIARYVAAGWVARKTGGRLKQIIEGAEAEGWRFVALTRLVPLVPFNLLNYALGLTRIRAAEYTLATLVCMVPGAAAYAWLGHAGREAAAGNADALRYALLGLGLLALVVFLPRLVRRGRGAGWISISELRRRLDSGRTTMIVDVREPNEFGGPLNPIPAARNVPLSELPARINEFATTRGPVVLVCRTDKRSAKAAEILRGAGIGDVMVLRGGMEEWNREAESVPGNPSNPGDE